MTANGNDPFAAPAAPGGGVKWEELHRALVLITVHEAKTGISTAYGTGDAVRADIAVLDGELSGTEYEDALVFPKVLQSQLRPRIGQRVLGRVSQGMAKAGQSAPWMLTEATPADKERGLAHLNQQLPAEPW